MKKLYFNKLDSLRFIAFFLVFWQHGFSSSFSEIAGNNKSLQKVVDALTVTGGIGVHLFFVISGFLITLLLIKEEQVQGKINLGFFYVRRILRIWPLYYLVLILGMFVLPFLFDTFTFKGNIPLNLLFLNNFDMVSQAPNVGITWSVAIEEQFYLFWPLLFMLLPNKRHLLVLSFILFVGSCLFNIYFPSLSYFHTFGNIVFLMTGCMGAIIYTKNEQAFTGSSMMESGKLPYAIVGALCFIILSDFSETMHYLAVVALPLLYIYIVLNVVIQSDGVNVSRISTLGKYTYGMYLYHPMIVILTKICFDLAHLDYIGNAYIHFLLAIISLAITIVFSIFSYTYFELYILNYKSKFSFVKTRV